MNQHIRLTVIQCRFRRMILLFNRQRTFEMLSFHTQMNRIEPFGNPINLIWESCIRDNHIVPFILKERQDINDEVYPLVRLLLPDNIRTDMLEKGPALTVFQSVPAEECGAYVFDEIAIMANQDLIAFVYESAFENRCTSILTVLCVAGDQNYFHAVSSPH